MIVQCAVCEADIEETEALIFDQEEGEEEALLVCSKKCLAAVWENPELYSPGLHDDEEA